MATSCLLFLKSLVCRQIFRPIICRSVRHGASRHPGPNIKHSLLSHSYGSVLGNLLTRDGSIMYSSCRPSPAQLFSGSVPGNQDPDSRIPKLGGPGPNIDSQARGSSRCTTRHSVPISSRPTTSRVNLPQRVSRLLISKFSHRRRSVGESVLVWAFVWNP